jgi:imidazolonepropionase-like amidohydrolase
VPEIATSLIRAQTVIGHEGADAVLVEDDHIAAVGDAEDLAGREVGSSLDLVDKTLVPGFIDTHVHMTGNGAPSAPVVIQQDSHANLLLRAATNSRRALAEGVTTMRDCGGLNDMVFAFREAAEAGIVLAPNILATGGTLTRTGGHGHWWGLEADDGIESRKAIRFQSKEGADGLKVMVDGGIDLGRHIPGLLYFDPDEMTDVVREAREWGLLTAAHCLTAPGVRAAVQAGVNSVEHCIFYEEDLDDTQVDRDVIAAIVEKGIYVDPGLGFAYDVFSDPDAPTTFPRNARLLKRRMDDTGVMHQEGVKLVAGTDAGWYATPFGAYARCPRLFVESCGFTPEEALAACTSVAAESLGLGDVTGTIDVGKRADLVALDGDPRDDIQATERVHMTMVRGEIVFERPGKRG